LLGSCVHVFVFLPPDVPPSNSAFSEMTLTQRSVRFDRTVQ
jgi:hypothetical protein